MSDIHPRSSDIKVKGKSWVISMPEDFTLENDLQKGTQVLLTFVKSGVIQADILPPLSTRLKKVADRVLKKRKKVFGELKVIGD